MSTDKNPNLIKKCIDDELWREYEWLYQYKTELRSRVYRIEDPKFVYIRELGSTHRVVDTDGVAHCVPAPGHMGCILRWKSHEGFDPVSF